MNLTTFKEEMIPEAARLLALRHQKERTKFPHLPARFEQIEHAIKAIEGLKEKGPVIGVAAFTSEKMIGYMIAQTLDQPQRGRHAWFDYAGFAIAPGQNEELIRLLYSKLGKRLVELGYFSHFVLTPCADGKVLDAWFRVCFAYEQVHGILEIPEQPGSEDSSIRLCNKSDETHVREMSNIIQAQVASAPAWGATMPEMIPEFTDGYAELLDDSTIKFWGAFTDEGKIASCIASWPDEESDSNMRIPERCMTVSCVATKSEYRGKGLSNKLLTTALNDGKQRGFQYCETDWRIANIPISNFLPKRGFVPYAYRLHRQIDSRILWANGVNSTNNSFE